MLGKAAFFLRLFFERKQKRVLPEQPWGIAPYALFKASLFETTVLKRGRKERKG